MISSDYYYHNNDDENNNNDYYHYYLYYYQHHRNIDCLVYFEPYLKSSDFCLQARVDECIPIPTIYCHNQSLQTKAHHCLNLHPQQSFARLYFKRKQKHTMYIKTQVHYDYNIWEYQHVPSCNVTCATQHHLYTRITICIRLHVLHTCVITLTQHLQI